MTHFLVCAGDGTMEHCLFHGIVLDVPLSFPFANQADCHLSPMPRRNDGMRAAAGQNARCPNPRLVGAAVCPGQASAARPWPGTRQRLSPHSRRQQPPGSCMSINSITAKESSSSVRDRDSTIRHEARARGSAVAGPRSDDGARAGRSLRTWIGHVWDEMVPRSESCRGTMHVSPWPVSIPPQSLKVSGARPAPMNAYLAWAQSHEPGPPYKGRAASRAQCRSLHTKESPSAIHRWSGDPA